jgi:hypothetical protein
MCVLLPKRVTQLVVAVDGLVHARAYQGKSLPGRQGHRVAVVAHHGVF